MKTTELKDNLYKFIEETDNVEILIKINTYFEQLRHENTDWWDFLSVYEQMSVNKGIEQLDSGQGIPYSEVKEKVSNLFSKYE